MTPIPSLWSKDDLTDMADRNLAPSDLQRQVQLLHSGQEPIAADRPCSVGDGIRLLDDPSPFLHDYEQALAGGRIMRFVPASGAASRMFDVIHEAGSTKPIDSWIADIHKLPFFKEWKAACDLCGMSFDELSAAGKIGRLVDVLLNSTGLNFGGLPKALIPFHRYADETRTAFDEHIVETAMLAGTPGLTPVVHFTVSDHHREALQKAAESVHPKYPQVEVRFSTQDPSTDTVCLDAAGRVLRDDRGRIVFRPGGHGSLLQNLRETGGDIVVIKNIDNVMPEDRLRSVIYYRQVLIGMLVSLQGRLHAVLGAADRGLFDFHEIRRVLTELDIAIPLQLETNSTHHVRDWLYQTLDRPIRVCAMVQNTGHPGGGPFWVRTPEGPTKQIVEQDQLVRRGTAVSAKSTHFNPVDMVCGLKDHKGQPFNLDLFTDARQNLITQKTHRGQKIRILEWPGLWNGAMARWLTVFVEVPSQTFTPVKTVLDLLTSDHQVS